MDSVDCIVIGAGVVGLAVARQMSMKGFETIILEQHDLIGSETSSRNSEVIHAGIYYPQNSLKALLCVEGKGLLYDYCRTRNIPHEQCGKIIVASKAEQVSTVQGYISQARANGVDDLQWLSADEVNSLEPEVKTVGGVFSPSTGIVDSHAYMLSLQGEFEAHGGYVAFNTQVESVEVGDNLVVHTAEISLRCDQLINCAGLNAPGFAQHLPSPPKAHFAKGHYYAYSGKQPFSRLVYPVAESGGLGVHVTMDLAGQIKFGPDVRWMDHADYAFDESHFHDFVNAIRAYYPDLDASRLHPSYTGIRPKLSGSGGGFEDFCIMGPEAHGLDGLVHLLGVESPGLTASLAIAERVTQQFNL